MHIIAASPSLLSQLLLFWQSTIHAYITSLPPIQSFIVSIALTLIATAIIGTISLSIAKYIFSLDGDFDEHIFKHVHIPMYVSTFLIGLYFSFNNLSLQPTTNSTIESLILTVGVLLWGWALWNIGTEITKDDSKTNLIDKPIRPRVNNLWKVGTVTGIIFSMLHIWGVTITPFLASAGLAGVVIGFAAKDAIANFFGGLALLFDNTYEKGDFIVLESGEEGTVIDVGVRSTTLLTLEGIQITVPNSVLNNSIVTNESAPQTHRRISIPINVSYGTDIETVRSILKEIAEESEVVRDEPPTRVQFMNMGDSGLEIQLMCWINRPNLKVHAINELNTSIYQRFNKEGITIPFPQRSIHFKNTDMDPKDSQNTEK